MKRALIITTVSGFVPQFEMNRVQLLQQFGYEVHYASNFRNPHYGVDNHRLDDTGMILHQIDFVRSPFRIGKNGKAYWQLKKLMKEISFQLIHCHTPMGGVLGRLAAEGERKRRRHVFCRNQIGNLSDWMENGKKNSRDFEKIDRLDSIKVFYTAHGFHFYQGAPFLNWVFYYPVEWWLAHSTDALITINQEDYMRAQRFHLRRGGNVWKVNGVGLSPISSLERKGDRNAIRKCFGILPEEYVFLSIGELSNRKNHQVVIKALNILAEKADISRIRYLICGEGRERKHLCKLIQKSSLEKQVMLMGYQENIELFLQEADCFIFPSLQEGLPVALLEAMQEGLPIIASNIRGNRELVEGEAFFVEAKDVGSYAKAMRKVMQMKKGRKMYTKLPYYEESYVAEQMAYLYTESLKET